MEKLDLLEIRKELHKIPEKGYEEKETQKFLLNILQKFDCFVIKKIGTGILVEYSQGAGKYKLFRSDMDALPFRELTGAEFASGNFGWMHACGHDMHMSVLLGLIEKVAQNRPAKNLLFLFQPAEELGLGAQSVIDSGALAIYDIEAAIALHISPSYAVGQVASKVGAIFAAAQEFDFEITGKAAHAARPEDGRDALLAGCELARKLQKLKTDSNRICVGKMSAGNVRNAIAEKAVLQGTHRSLSEKAKQELNLQFRTVADEVESEFGVQIALRFGASTTPVVNDADLFAKWKVALPARVEFVEASEEYTAEDFCVFSSHYPGLLFWLGGGVSEFGLHNEHFLPDGRAIAVGVESFYCLI